MINSLIAGEKLFKCKYCPKFFHGREMRKNHYATNELCQQKYQSHIGKLLDHGLECRFCDASFGFKEDLIGHMRIHKGQLNSE